MVYEPDMMQIRLNDSDEVTPTPYRLTANQKQILVEWARRTPEEQVRNVIRVLSEIGRKEVSSAK